MSTYDSDNELSGLRISSDSGGPLDFVDVASSSAERDVRLCLGGDEFYMDPDDADRLAAALVRQAAAARRIPEIRRWYAEVSPEPTGGHSD